MFVPQRNEILCDRVKLRLIRFHVIYNSPLTYLLAEFQWWRTMLFAVFIMKF